MAKINLNRLAVKVADVEGGHTQVNIAQIKEVLSIALSILAVERPSDVLAMLESRAMIEARNG